jgi:hypothetical protein
LLLGKGEADMRKRVSLSLFLIISFVLCYFTPITAKAYVSIYQTKVTINKGKTYQIDLFGASGSVKWSASNKHVKITKKTNSYAKVKAVSVGKTVIKAKVGKKTYKCTVTVKDKKQVSKFLYVTDVWNGTTCLYLTLKNTGDEPVYVGNRVFVSDDITYGHLYDYGFEDTYELAPGEKKQFMFIAEKKDDDVFDSDITYYVSSQMSTQVEITYKDTKYTLFYDAKGNDYSLDKD